MNIVTGLESLIVEGIEGEYDEVIETVLSKLFVRGDNVYKAYKHRTADFADLTDTETRRAYIAEDFFWNQKMSPDIYLELKHVAHNGEQYVHVNAHEAEDWYMVMKKVTTERSLMNLLEAGTLKQQDLEQYIRALDERLASLTQDRKSDLEAFFTRGTEHIQSEILGVCDWALTATPELALEDVVRAKQLMLRALNSHSYWKSPIETISVVIDNNADNILFLGEGASFIDVMPPKNEWRVHDRYFALCRTSADVSTLSNREDAEVLHTAYALTRGLPSAIIVRATYEISAALIQVPYRKMVGRDDLAQKYADFVRSRCNDLELLLNTEEQSN